MERGFHPALLLFQRFILGPGCVVFLVFGGWALASRHWLSAVFLLTACFLGVVLLVSLPVGREEPEERSEAAEEELEADDSRPLATAIVRTNLLLCALLIGLVWSEHLPLMHWAVFVVLFSIVFPAGAALFCIVGEQIMRVNRERGRVPPRMSPPWHGMPKTH